MPIQELYKSMYWKQETLLYLPSCLHSGLSLHPVDSHVTFVSPIKTFGAKHVTVTTLSSLTSSLGKTWALSMLSLEHTRSEMK